VAGRVVVASVGVVALAILVGYVLYSAQFSGIVQWGLGVAFLGALVAFAATSVARRTRAPEPLLARSRDAGVLEGELAYLVGTIGRAERGMTFSRELVGSRIREAVAERVRVVRGLSPESMRDLEADEARLREAVRDGVLADFLYETRTRERLLAWASRDTREGFIEAVRPLVERLEAWR
jgi:hypothetical protein